MSGELNFCLYSLWPDVPSKRQLQIKVQESFSFSCFPCTASVIMSFSCSIILMVVWSRRSCNGTLASCSLISIFLGAYVHVEPGAICGCKLIEDHASDSLGLACGDWLTCNSRQRWGSKLNWSRRLTWSMNTVWLLSNISSTFFKLSNRFSVSVGIWKNHSNFPIANVGATLVITS